MIEVGRQETKGSSLFSKHELSKVQAVKDGLKDLESKSHSDRLVFWNSATVLGSGSYIGDETKPIPHPKTGLEPTVSSGIKFRIGNYPDMPEYMKVLSAQLDGKQVTNEKPVCSFCGNSVDHINASYGTGTPRSIAVQEIVDHDKDGNPIIQVKVKRSADKLVACPEHVGLIKPIKDKYGRIINNNCKTESEG